jgi:putative ABC transport system permease protein
MNPLRSVFSAARGGVLVGVLGVKLLVTAPVIRGPLEPNWNAALFAQGLTGAVLVGVFSDIYPAQRTSRLSASRALRDQ